MKTVEVMKPEAGLEEEPVGDRDAEVEPELVRVPEPEPEVDKVLIAEVKAEVSVPERCNPEELEPAVLQGLAL